METIRNSYIEANEAVNGELFFEIALCKNDEDKNQIVNQEKKLVKFKMNLNVVFLLFL